jgi:hypothetical protein
MILVWQILETKRLIAPAVEFVPSLLVLDNVSQKIRRIEGLHPGKILQVCPHHIVQPRQSVDISRNLNATRDTLSSTHEEVKEALIDEVFGLHYSGHKHVRDDVSIAFEYRHLYSFEQLLSEGPHQKIDPFLDGESTATRS